MFVRYVIAIFLGAASCALAHDGPHQAIDRLTAALEREPDRADLLLKRAFQHRVAEHPEAALADLDRARALDPSNAQIALHRGHTLVLLNRHAEADGEYSTFLATDPAHVGALAGRARVRAALGRHSAAIQDYDSALRTVDDVDLYLERGRLQESIGRLADAARDYARGVQRLSGAIVLRQALIRVETRRGHHDAALALIDDAERSATTRTVWHLQRAEVLRAAGRSEESRRSLEHALVEAERVLARRRSPLNLYQRARVHVALGDTSAARRDLQAALQAAPRFKKAQALLVELEAPAAQNSSREEREHDRESYPE